MKIAVAVVAFLSCAVWVVISLAWLVRREKVFPALLGMLSAVAMGAAGVLCLRGVSLDWVPALCARLVLACVQGSLSNRDVEAGDRRRSWLSFLGVSVVTVGGMLLF